MIIEEFFDINGTSHVRHYSDAGLMIASDDGIEYEVAEDFTELNKIYHETSTPIPRDDEESDSEANDILNILLGEE